jgi:hypothetical protein
MHNVVHSGPTYGGSAHGSGPGGQAILPADPATPCDMVTVPERQGLETVGAADAWHLPGHSCTQAPPPESDRNWLLPPSPERALTDPALLRAALGEAARTLAASGSDGC